jgi:hypothetical protein
VAPSRQRNLFLFIIVIPRFRYWNEQQAAMDQGAMKFEFSGKSVDMTITSS